MEDYADYVPVFKALSDETRLKIVEMLSCEEMCACDILEYFQITQPTLSYHMKILTGCGLVTARKEGAWMNYAVNKAMLTKIKDFWVALEINKETCICKDIKEVMSCESSL